MTFAARHARLCRVLVFDQILRSAFSVTSKAACWAYTTGITTAMKKPMPYVRSPV